MIRFFVLDEIHNKRGDLFPLLKPFVKGGNFSDAERMRVYGVSEKDWEWVETAKLADVIILPMSWNFYVYRKELNPVLKLLEAYKKYNRPIWSFMTGDFGVNLPQMEGVTIFRSNGNKSKLSGWHIGMPVFIRDPLIAYYKQEKPDLRTYQSNPVVGFCGQADGSMIGGLLDSMRTLYRNLQFFVGIRKELPQPLYSTKRLRARILGYCEKSDRVSTNFIFRKKYRAGVKSNVDRERTAREFYNNIRDSDYVICIRGGGNFSVRFYETLAMGRIPVYLDTDGLMPLENAIHWKTQIVWVPFNEQTIVDEKIYKFHSSLDDERYQQLLLKNRRIWKEKLSMDGFFKSHLLNEEMKL